MDLPRKKAQLLQTILTLSHHSDLGRCRDNGNGFITHLLEKGESSQVPTRLLMLFPTTILGHITARIVRLVHIGSKETGTVIRDYPENYFDLSKKLTCVTNTAAMIQHIQRIDAAEEGLRAAETLGAMPHM